MPLLLANEGEEGGPRRWPVMPLEPVLGGGNDSLLCHLGEVHLAARHR